MVRSIISFALVILVAVPAYAGDGPDRGKMGPGTLAVHFQQNAAAGNPGRGPASTEAVSQMFFTGAAAGDDFGFSVASAGDVNGDGYADVIVGAYYNDAGGSAAGRAYIYFGGPGMDATADLVLTGAAASDRFGVSVAGAGDVNGDGYSDVIVGAYLNDVGGSNAGRAYIYLGGPAADAAADVILTGKAADDQFGECVAGAGDVNGDGYGDVIVGATYNDAGGLNAGRAYIYYGGPAADSTVDVTLTGEAVDDRLGAYVAGAGDVNGDGYSDVIVGAPGNDAGGVQAGRSYIYYGGTGMDAVPDVTLTGEAASDAFGVSVACAGDVNNDGYADVIAGAPLNGAVGRAYIFYGGSVMDATVDVILTGANVGDYFGLSVAGAGDVNGDGYADVIVAAPNNSAGAFYAGRAYVFCGGPAMDAIADVLLTGAVSYDYFGYSVAGAGDVNADGFSDLIVGAYYNDAGGSNAGRAYLYCNSLTGSDLPDEFITGAATGDFYGWSVAGAGDVNGDGFGDVIVGAFGNDAGGADAGSAYIYYGGPGMDTTADITLTGAASLDAYGWSVAGAGDVNGDGYSDVIVGAYLNDAGGALAGRAYIYYGGPGMNSTADVTLTGAVAGDNLGYSAAGAGDVNGDGFGDVIVGAPNNDTGGANAGQAYVYFGGAAMNATADLRLTGAAASDYFGRSVAGAGDVNGDGYGDLIVGAEENDAGGDLCGRAYIYLGGSGVDTVADVTLTGVAAGDFFGASVGGGGDVNGDGYDDVIVGAIFHGPAGAQPGEAYVFYGGADPDNAADVTIPGAGADDLFGTSVACAGDVNSDGYADVIVGAHLNSAAGTNSGRAYLYFGGRAMNSTADVTMTGGLAYDYFGYSAAGAGDVNGDGFDDVIVGAYGTDARGGNSGRAYIYYSSSIPIVPRIMSVQDAPSDQGGTVRVAWARSGYDSRNVSRVTGYLVERSYPPGITGFQWEQIAGISATHNPQYLYSAATPCDSTSNASGTFFFRVTARTSNSNEYWRSNIVSGHSVDNLAPLAVGGLSAVPVTTSSVRVSWPANTHDADLGAYVVYRSTTNGFVPGGGDQIQALADTSYLDNSLPTAPIIYYRVRARDIHGNLGGLSPQAAVALATTQNYGVASSWNMISVPMNVDDYTKTVMYPTAISEAFAYSGGYVTRSTLENGTGYWLKFPSAQSVSMTGFAQVGDTIPVLSGWNMVGSIGAGVPVTQVTSNPPGLVVSPFYTYSGGYVSAATIEPHKGYWVKAQQAGELLLTLNGQLGGAVQIVETSERPPNPPEMVSAGREEEIPTVFALEQNFPNPFNPTTVVRYQVPVASQVRLVVYDVLGREVKVLVDERKAAGYHEVVFDAAGLASGTYLYRMTSGTGGGSAEGTFMQTMKLILLR